MHVAKLRANPPPCITPYKAVPTRPFPDVEPVLSGGPTNHDWNDTECRRCGARRAMVDKKWAYPTGWGLVVGHAEYLYGRLQKVR